MHLFRIYNSLHLLFRCSMVLLLLVGTAVGQVSLDVEEEASFQAAANYAQGSIVQIETFGGQEFVNRQVVAPGPFTGTVLTKEGWIATSLFFFRSQPASITVILPNNDRKAAKLVARDYSREIAILKIDSDSALKPAIPSPAGSWQIGGWTIALGKSFDVLTASRSVGILSAVGRIWDKAIQTDCKISPQNYGGPLIDLSGRVMGVLTPINPGIVTEGEVEQWYDSGIGFAIPLADILERLPRLQKGEDIHPGKVGISVRGKDEFAEGIHLIGVSPGSPGFKGGLRAGDDVVRAGRTRETLRPVATHSNLKHVLGGIDAGETLVLEVKRGEELKTFEMVLEKELPKYREPYLGLITRKSGDGSEEILQIVPESPAAKEKLPVGGRIKQLGMESLTDEQGLDQLLPYLDYRESIEIEVESAQGDVAKFTLQPTPRPDGDVSIPPFQYPTGDADVAGGKDSEEGPARGTVQIPLGDVKNRAFAIVPNKYSEQVPHGVLVVYADAGPVEMKNWTNVWENFCEENRWICAVIQSADEKSWTFEEVEVGQRVRAFLGSNYTIDSRRTCVAGIASGGLVALITSVQSRNDFNSVWLCESKLDPRIRIQPAEPGRATRYFINGTDEVLKRFASRVEEAGYGRSFYEEEFGNINAPDGARVQDSPVFEKLLRWLRHLEAL